MASPGRDSRRRYSLALIVLTSITLITLDQRAEDKGPLGVIGRVAHRVVSPIASAVDSVFEPIGDWLSGISNGNELRDQNRELRREVKRLLGEQRKADKALAENEDYARFFGIPWLDNIPQVGARVISDAPAGNFEDTLILSRGSEAGIRVGHPVVVSDALVGRIVEVWNGGSKVLLVTDPSFGVAVRVDDDRIRGPAEGQPGSDTLKLNLSSADLSDEQEASIEVGDQVDTCGCDGSEYPPRLPVGEIVRKDQQTSGISLIVRVRPYFDRASLDLVLVLLWEPGDPVPPPPSPPDTTTTTAPVTPPT